MNGRCDLSYKRYPVEEGSWYTRRDPMRVHPSQKVTNMEAAIMNWYLDPRGRARRRYLVARLMVLRLNRAVAKRTEPSC
jgi:hypothetical protein